MRISEIKDKVQDSKARRLVKWLWDYEYADNESAVAIFRNALSECSPDEPIEKVFLRACDVLCQNPELYEDKLMIKTFKYLSENILGDRYAFAEGTLYGEKHKAFLERKKFYEDRFNDLSFLYDALDIKPIGSNDIVKNISRCDLHDIFMEHKEAIIKNPSLAYDLAEERILSILGTPEYGIHYQKAIYFLSYKFKDDNHYWITHNNIDTSLLLYRKTDDEQGQSEENTEI